VKAAAETILMLHIGGGTVSMASGMVALLAPKGERLHRIAGNVFFVAMLFMSGIGAVVSPFLNDRVSSVAGTLTFYMVCTAWLTVMRKEGTVGRLEVAGLLVALGVCAAGLTFLWMAAYSPSGTVDGQPVQALYVFATIGAIAAAGDLNLILRGGLRGVSRIARHLWRMTFALLVATGSFFLGQQKVMPHAWHGSLWLFVLAFAPLPFLLFWIVRVRIGRRFRHDDAALVPAE
jgi:uncharacterized membrane protein